MEDGGRMIGQGRGPEAWSEPRRLTAAVWVLAMLAGLAAILFAAGGWGEESAGASGPGATKEGLVAVERAWLNARDAATLERILAPDYVHVIPGAGFMTREQQLAWFKAHPVPPGVERHFEDLRERIYGDVGIVNGVVVRTIPGDTKPYRTLFTDVFAYQDGRWQAVNSQENEER